MKERGLRAKGNFIEDWVGYEKEMNGMGFMGDFELRENYEKIKRRALGIDEEGLSVEEMIELLKSLGVMNGEMMTDKDREEEEIY